ncbi:lytic murein transglycosylase [Rhizobium leguminosarum]|uniref:lytic murein transglycosylase n=1 Tax=Rhizobium leguminosarum TaxID=384 RepID=UPI001C913707|nr:lytic murein transglycosylase [Rhizobium leguminosarum]MBY2993784.1 lytic murein transglycosylase [Rhizobium leguminosarum]MBY3055234.1 lytic murein transglycosylase [Rhizobium leguminosarum]
MGFLFGGDTGQSQESVTDSRKRLALAMLQRGGDTSPIASPWQGAARLVDAVMGGYDMYKQDKQTQADTAEAMATLTGQPYTPPEKPAGFLSSIFGGNKAANPGATGSSMPKVDASGNVAATPTNGPLPASFLAAVDHEEGAGNYDTLYGHAQKNGPFAGTAVSTMPIRDVIAFTDPSGPYAQSVKDQIGRVATPVGRYQVVGTTLRNAVGALGLDPNAPFDKNAQDAVGAYLARQRIASADSLPGQMAALRQEWHGFKNVPDEQLAQVVADLRSGGTAGMAPSPIQPPPVNPPAPAPTPGYVDPAITTAGRPDAPPMPQAAAPGEVASLDPSIGIPMPGAAGQMRASAPAQPMAPQGVPQAGLSPLPSSTVGPTQNVASVPPAGQQIPPEFQNSQQLMNADPNSGIMPALLGGSPASPEQVAQAQQSGQARLAHALGSASPQQAANPMANPRAQALVKVLSNPNVPEPMKQMAAQQLQILTKPPEYGFETLPDGTVLRSDPRAGTLTPVYRSEMSQADQARLKLEQDKLAYERGKPTEVNGRLVGADGKVIADFSNGQWERMSDGTLYNKSTGEIRQAPGGAGGEKFYGSTVPYYDKDGNLRYRQLGDKGGGKDLDFGPGSTAAPTTRTVDTGTELITLGPGGQEVKRTTKENYEAAKETAQGSTEGKAAGDAVSSLPADLMQADQTIKNIDELLTSKGLDSIVGSVDQFRPSWTMGADGRDALTRLKQLQGGAFLQAYGLLKGGGQITEVEGGKAQDAMARMDRSLDEPHFRAALKDFRDAVEQGVAKMKERAKVAAPSAPADPAVVPTDVPGVTIRRRQ